MRVVFMGTPEFAVASLEAICKSKHEVVGVVTSADKPAGRGKKLRSSAVKDYAVENGLALLQPEKLRDPNFIDALSSLKADVFVVVAFRMLPEIVWSLPKQGTFNLHGSLLPDYRGAAPINHAIMNGDRVSGVTTFLIEKEIDTGNVLFQEEVEIKESDNAGELHDKLMETGASLVIKTLDAIENNEAQPIPQSSRNKDGLPWRAAPKLNRENCRLDWTLTADQVHNKIRGLSPYPGAYTFLKLKTGAEIQFKVLESELTDQDSTQAGDIDTDNKNFLKVACGDKFIQVHVLQMEGKRAMKTDDFLRGFQFDSTEKML